MTKLWKTPTQRWAVALVLLTVTSACGWLPRSCSWFRDDAPPPTACEVARQIAKAEEFTDEANLEVTCSSITKPGYLALRWRWATRDLPARIGDTGEGHVYGLVEWPLDVRADNRSIDRSKLRDALLDRLGEILLAVLKVPDLLMGERDLNVRVTCTGARTSEPTPPKAKAKTEPPTAGRKRDAYDPGGPPPVIDWSGGSQK